MKAFASVVAVLLLLSCSSRAQMAAGLAAQAAAGQTLAESSKPDAAPPSIPSESATASASSGEAAAATADAAPAVRFRPGVKLFLEPMNGYGELLSEAITKKKVPVILVDAREKADFVLSGEAELVKRGWLKGMVLYPHAKADLAIRNAHTGAVVFAYKLDEKQESMSAGQLYESSAYNCAKHLKKAIQKR